MSIRQEIWVVLGLCLLAGAIASPLAGQQSRWEELNARVAELYQQGKYAEAIPVAQEALRLAEATLGPEHPDVASLLNNLALLYEAQGKYAEAEPLCKCALATWEKARAPEGLNVGTGLENDSALLRSTNREGEAKELSSRAKANRAKHGQSKERPACSGIVGGPPPLTGDTYWGWMNWACSVRWNCRDLGFSLTRNVNDTDHQS